jgi:phosphoribosyl 1,2-cyclic phosphodiesterase
MRIEFWGARGSIPSSHPGTARYGGNTSCVEIRTRSNDHIILDCGTGIRRLGVKMMGRSSEAEEIIRFEKMVEFVVEDLMQEISFSKKASLRALEGSMEYKDEMHLFLSHYHWDHIQGFPFFIPAYAPGKKLNIFGPLKADHRLRDVISGQMSGTYFPVHIEAMASTMNFHEIVEDTVRIGDATVMSRALNHPQGSLGYRITSGEMVVAYATDTEHPEKGIDMNLLELADGADILIYDAQYTPEEYKSKKNWGHSTWLEGVKIAREAGAKKLILFHHDPEHNDTVIDAIREAAKLQFPNVMAAYEGLALIDAPDNPTLDVPDRRASEAEETTPPEIISIDRTTTVRCGSSLIPLASVKTLGMITAELESGKEKIIFDCSKTIYSNRYEMTALADVLNILRGRISEIEIAGAGEELFRRMEIARFGLLAQMKKKKNV